MAQKNLKNIKSENVEMTAELKYLRVTPRKVRLVTDAVKGLSVL